MATQPVPDVAQFQTVYQSDAQRIQNDFYFHKEGDWAESDLNAVNGVIEAWYEATMKDMLPVEIALVDIIGTCLTSLDSPRVAGELAGPSSGILASPILPLNVTIAVKLQTSNRGRGRNGRIFWPAMGESSVVGDKVTDAYAGLIIAAIDALHTAVVTDVPGTTPVVVHRYRDGVKLAVGDSSPIVQVLLSDTYIDSQRDRLPFHKKHKKARLP